MLFDKCFLSQAKEEGEEEEGTISRPSSPKDEVDGTEANTAEETAVPEKIPEVKIADPSESRGGSANMTGRGASYFNFANI